MNADKKIIARFFKTESGTEPVRNWIKKQSNEDKKAIGDDIKLVEFRWPLGMPTVRKLDTDLWEVRSNISRKRISRVIFTVIGRAMLLLHGFVKKSQKTPKKDIDLAKNRMAAVKKQHIS